MTREAVGNPLKLEADKIYVIVSTDEDGDIQFGVIDTVDYSTDQGRFLAIMTRGMIASVINNPDEMLEIGTKAFVNDDKETDVVVNDTSNEDGTVIPFPKTVGNA